MNFTDKVLCVGLKTACLGTAAQDAEATTDLLQRYGAKRGKLRATKTILADAITPFKKLRGEARRYFNSVTLPGISDDLRITTPQRLPEVQKQIQGYLEKDAALLTALIANYPDEINKDRLDLGSAFDPNLYPPAQDLEYFFQINLTTCDMPQGDYARIQGLSTATQQQMQNDHQKMLTAVGNAARNDVFKKMTDMIAHIAQKMSDPDAKAYHESTFDKLRDYLAMVPDLNITGDQLLEDMRKAALEKLDLSMSVVKSSNFLKAKAAEDANNILKRFGSLGGRKLVA